LDVRVEHDSYIPVHAQVSEQIKVLILHGELAPGTRLPTARQLAGFLRINHNTILKAYGALAREGLIQCRRGRGCIVLEPQGAMTQPAATNLLAIVDKALEQAAGLGVGPDDLATFVYARAKQRREAQARPRLAFVECEAAIARTLAQIVQEKLGAEVVPVVLRDLQKPAPELERILHEVKVVTTTFFHVQEVKHLLAHVRKEVVGIGIKPHLESLIQVAGIPRGTSTAMVCVSKLCAQEMKQSLEDAGIKGLETVLGGTDDPHGLAEALGQTSTVIVSDFAAEKVRALVRPDQRLIVLDYTTLDTGAIDFLNCLMNEG